MRWAAREHFFFQFQLISFVVVVIVAAFTGSQFVHTIQENARLLRLIDFYNRIWVIVL